MAGISMTDTAVQWYIYIVRCSDDSLYTGITTDIKRRMRAHNNDTGPSTAKYTRARRPVYLVYQETATSRSHAARRESEIKNLSRRDKELLIDGCKAGSYL